MKALWFSIAFGFAIAGPFGFSFDAHAGYQSCEDRCSASRDACLKRGVNPQYCFQDFVACMEANRCP